MGMKAVTGKWKKAYYFSQILDLAAAIMFSSGVETYHVRDNNTTEIKHSSSR